MNKILVVVDMQNDFITGALGSSEAQAIVPSVVKKIEEYKKNKDVIIATFDTHGDDYLSTQEGYKLPVKHCVEGTEGWKLDSTVEDTLNGYSKYHSLTKGTFGSPKLVKKIKNIAAKVNDEVDSDWQIELVGLDFDICVISNAILLKSSFSEANVVVDLKCTAASSAEAFEATKTVMKSCQIDMIGE